MLDLAVGADDGRLAVTLDGLAAARVLQDLLGQHIAEDRREAMDLGLQILDVALARPRIGEHGRHRDEAQRRIGHAPALDMRVLDEGCDLADAGVRQLAHAGASLVALSDQYRMQVRPGSIRGACNSRRAGRCAPMAS